MNDRKIEETPKDRCILTHMENHIWRNTYMATDYAVRAPMPGDCGTILLFVGDILRVHGEKNQHVVQGLAAPKMSFGSDNLGPPDSSIC